MHALQYLVVDQILDQFVQSGFTDGIRGDQYVCGVALQVIVLSYVWSLVIAFVQCCVFSAVGDGDSGTEFEVAYEASPLSISVQPQIHDVDAALGISLIVISCIIFIFVDSLKELVQGTFL